MPPAADTTALTEPPGGLRCRARKAMQAEVAAVAMELFLERGFDNTTVEQITAVAGLSRSSFFRYFPTKEDVVLGNLADNGQQVLRALTERPDDEPPWTALRQALEPVIQSQTVNVERALRMARMILDTPSLRARHYEKIMTWQALLVPEVARRLHLPAAARDPRPTALIGCALACLDAALETWTATTGRTPFSDLVDAAMASIGPPDKP